MSNNSTLLNTLPVQVVHEQGEDYDTAAAEVIFTTLAAISSAEALTRPEGAAGSREANLQLYASWAIQALAPLADPFADERVTMSVGPDDEYEVAWYSPGYDDSPDILAELPSELDDPLGIALASSRDEDVPTRVLVEPAALTPGEAMRAAKAMLVAAYLAARR